VREHSPLVSEGKNAGEEINLEKSSKKIIEEE